MAADSQSIYRFHPISLPLRACTWVASLRHIVEPHCAHTRARGQIAAASFSRLHRHEDTDTKTLLELYLGYTLS